jgi:anti-sigma regulatory factor (Ser/Thr protein kinase)
LTTAAEILRLDVPADPGSLAEVRWSIDQLDELDTDTRATLKLLVTELVANSVRHGGLDPSERVIITVELHPGRVGVEVTDPGQGFAMPQGRMPGGRGFPMVQALSSRFGLRRNTKTHSWFEIDLPAALPRRDDAGSGLHASS